MTIKYTIILEKEEEGGYSAQCLELPGVISQGETKGEALKNIEEAVEVVVGWWGKLNMNQHEVRP